MTFEVLDGAAVRRRVDVRRAVDALRDRLSNDPPRPDRPMRTRVPVDHGQLLLMPDQSSRHVGVKIVSLAPQNSTIGLPTVQGSYLLMDADTLSPVAVIDAAELTLVRTAAVTMLGVLQLRPCTAPRVVVLGAGPQAVAHAAAAEALLAPRSISILARSERSTQQARGMVAERGMGAAVVVASATDQLSTADVVLCCTAAHEPVLTIDDLGNDVVVAAIGSHEPGVRELPTTLMEQAFVCVESAAVARREAGDVVIAEQELGHPVIDAELADLVRDAVSAPSSGRRVLKTVGEAWQDLTVAVVAVG